MYKLGAYIFLLSICVPGLYVFIELIKEEFTYIKHKMQRRHNKD
jgi:hypothetical protein